MSKVRILIVEDELIIAEDMKDILEDLGYEVVGITPEEQEAKRMLVATTPDLAILDITLGRNQSGLQVAKFINENIYIPLIFCTSYADKSTVSKAKELHPNGYLINPEATAISLIEGCWLYSGDFAYYDEEQNFFIVDRLKELIKT